MIGHKLITIPPTSQLQRREPSVYIMTNTLTFQTEWALGSPRLDSSHEELIMFLNDLGTIKKTDKVAIRRWGGRFLIKLRFHFIYEESLMRRQAGQIICDHTATHQNLLIAFKMMMEGLLLEHPPQISPEQFIGGFLHTEILGHDKLSFGRMR